MKNLLDKEVFNEINERLNKLNEHSRRHWGKMEVAQMLAHCAEAFKVPLSSKPLPRMFMGRLLGWAFKAKLYNDSEWGKGVPTSPAFIIKGQRNFENEKELLITLVNKFHCGGAEGITKYPHPFFGKYTPEQWGMSMYKHLDHHLRQFGV